MNDKRDKRMPILTSGPPLGVTGSDASGEYTALPVRVSRPSEIRAAEPSKLSFRYERVQERTPTEERDRQDRTIYADFELDTLDPSQFARFFVSRLHAIAARLTKPVNDRGEAVDFTTERTELYEISGEVEARLGHLALVSSQLGVVSVELDKLLALATQLFSRGADAERVKTFSYELETVQARVIAAMKKASEAPKRA